MTSEAQKRANAKYDNLNTTQIKLKLNNNTDADVLDKLAKEENKQGYIKNLIRQDINAPESEVNADDT